MRFEASHMNCGLAFAGSVTPSRCTTKHSVLYGTCGPSGPANGHVRHFSISHRDTVAPRKKGKPLTTLEKRRKDYFFKLLAAARSRDGRLFTSVMQSLSKEDRPLHQDQCFTDSLRVQDVLLKAASRCGFVTFASSVFKDMLTEGQFPTEHTAGAFLDALKLDGQTDRCLTAFYEMMDNGVDLGTVCFNIVVSALMQDGNVTTAVEMLERASPHWGIEPDTYTLNIFSSAGKNQGSAGNKAAYEKGLRLMMGWGVEPDIVTINARIHGSIQEGRLDEAVDTLEQALRGSFRGVIPDVITFNCGISAYMALHLVDRAFSLLDEMPRRGIAPRADTYNSILTGLIKMGDTSRVMKVFNRYFNGGGENFCVAPSLASYNLVLQALCLKKDVAQARLVYSEMRRRNVKPDNITLTALVRLQRSREDVYDIIQTARKLCIRPSLSFLNSCIRALGDHKDIYGACTVMDSIMALDNMDADVTSYNSLIFALVQHPWPSKVITDGEKDCHHTEALMGPPDVETADPRSNDGPGRGEGERLSYYVGRDRGRTIARLDGFSGAEAALILLEEMKTRASLTAPDTVTYTTVISGVVRAEDGRRVQGQGATWWRVPRNTNTNIRAKLDQADAPADSTGYISSGDMCQRLFMEALTRGVGVNGKICNAVLSGFGSDLEGAVKFWRNCIGPALKDKYSETISDDSPSQQMTNEEHKEDLLSAYCGLLHVCGRAQRPDAAVKVVFASRRDGITPSPTLSNTYFKAKKEALDHPESSRFPRLPFRIGTLLQSQMEDTLEVECGISKHSEAVDLPIERIRIRF